MIGVIKKKKSHVVNRGQLKWCQEKREHGNQALAVFAPPVPTGSLRASVLIRRQWYCPKPNIAIVIPIKEDRIGIP